MQGIRQYLLSIVTASLISALAIAFVGKKGLYSAVTKLLAGLFLSITVIAPWTNLEINDISSYFDSMEFDAVCAVAEGEHMAETATGTIIKEQTEAYILEKASAIGISVEVVVMFADTSPLLPHTVIITGNASPYEKQVLQLYITEKLGIPKERQSWI